MLAREVAGKYTSGRVQAEFKAGGDPVTAADIELDNVLREALVGDGDGWLSEETADDKSRLKKRRVWIVDPLDGTREFVEGIDEWCISVALTEHGRAIAAGICNPVADVLVLGSMATGVTLNGRAVRASEKTSLDGAVVLASRSEVKRGQWDRFMAGPFNVVPMGSVAYKLARVAAGLAEATFTFVPKNEWDIAAGVLLVQASGGRVQNLDGQEFTFNHPNTLVSGLIASGTGLFEGLTEHISQHD